MGTFFVYILKASVCLTAFYLFYRLLLSKETFHRFNRLALCGILVLSLVIPFCEITIHDNTEIQQTLVNFEQYIMQVDDVIQTTSAAVVTPSIPVWILLALLVYFLGILFFFGRTAYSLAHMLCLVRRGRKEKLEKGTILAVHDKDIAPFSWMKYIVISEKDLTENSKEILAHEMAHIRNRHSVDLLISDLCICFQWFNPASWLLKQELQTIHEYEADDSVIRQGINAKQYQLLLIKKAVGTRLYSMANSFNHSKLKKRITMMLKEKSSPWARAKYLYVLPLAVIALTAFARPEISGELNEISAIKVNDFTSILETKAANNPVPEQDSLTTKTTVKTSAKDGVIYITTTSSNDSLVTLTIRKDTLSRSSRVLIRDTVIDGGTYIISSRISDESLDTPLFIVEGQEVDQKAFRSLPPQIVKSITILKDKAATSVYGEKGRHGVVNVELVKDFITFSPIYVLSAQDSIITLADGTKVKLSSQTDLVSQEIQPNGREIQLQGESYFSVTKQDEHPHFRLRMSEVKVVTSPSVIEASGTILDQDGNPIAGATVSTQGVQTNTDKDGKFLLVTGKNDKLTVTAPGMKKVKIKTAPNLSIHMKKAQ
ncbi:M56 family metallopeptidase [Butyricimonas muris]|uniref:M56 family metallopeptidase n=1 Tax=Butyricimonas muris TaxID=3378067 RepID=UPI0039676419